MIHEAYVRVVPNADTAVLFIHGICGTPNHFSDLIPLLELVPEDYSIYNVLLDGHGKSVEDFSKTSMKKWHEQIWRTFEELSDTHKHIVLVGHSMGTLFSIQLAAQHPDVVPFLLLFAVPLRPKMGLTVIRNSLKLVFGKLRDDVPQESAMNRACGITPTRKLWKYLGWIPCFLELFLEMFKTERVLQQLTVPCTAFQSQRDELIAFCGRKILERNDNVSVRILPDSSHFYYHPGDQAMIRNEFERKIKETHG